MPAQHHVRGRMILAASGPRLGFCPCRPTVRILVPDAPWLDNLGRRPIAAAATVVWPVPNQARAGSAACAGHCAGRAPPESPELPKSLPAIVRESTDRESPGPRGTQRRAAVTTLPRSWRTVHYQFSIARTPALGQRCDGREQPP